MITLVVILTVRSSAADLFRSFERQAAVIMSRHGGAIERTVVVRGRSEDLFREIHIVTFPGDDAFAAYRDDPELSAIAHLREASVTATEVMVGEDGPDYGVMPQPEREEGA